MSEQLTDQEYSVLLIGMEGAYLAPIGSWEEPVLSLAKRGLMQRFDAVNYGITPAGAKAARERDSADHQALVGLAQKAQAIQTGVQAKIEEAARLLAEATISSTAATGDRPSDSLDRWARIVTELAARQL